jgi:ligand-binding sensor domain-containing protein
MARKQAFILSIVLPLMPVCAMACTGPKPTPTPRFYKLGDSIDFVAVAPDGTVWVSISEYGDENVSTPVSHGIGVAHFTDAAGTGDGQMWTTYTADDGLASNWAGPIAVAPDGTVWFGTAGGATRFTYPAAGTGDGAAWTTFSAEDGLAGEVQAMAIAPDGAVWFGTRGGVSRFGRSAAGAGDGATWTTYTTADGLPEDLVMGIAVVEGIAVAPDGVVWVATDNNGVSRFDGKTWTTYTEDDGLADNSVNAVAVAPDGTVWFGTHSGVSRFTDPASTPAPHARSGAGGMGDGETWTTYTQEHGLAPTGIDSIIAAPDSTVWISYYGWTYGISHFNGESWITYTEDDGLPNNAVTCIDVAPDGALWVGTEAGTISRFSGGTWTTYTVQDITSR